jgi:hypothetical protein
VKSIILMLLMLVSLSQGAAQTIVDVAASDPRFSTLVTAIEEAGLVEALSGEGPFTVFAPTNDAFAAIDQNQLNVLLSSQSQLTTVLQYHVVPGLFTTDLITADMQFFTTLAGSNLPITNDGVGGAAVIDVNIEASNGVIHVVDTVLVPMSVSLGAPRPPAMSSEDPNMANYTNRAMRSVRYSVASQGGSGVLGSVLLADYGEGLTVVTIALQGTPPSGNHPAHFHAGNCGSGGDIVVPLNNVNGATGFSTTVTNVPFDDIVGGDHYLNIHLSSDQIGTIVACGEVGL